MPPKAVKRPHKLLAHDHEREDSYYWMRDRENPEVIDYLNQENAYTEEMLADVRELREELFEEMKARIKQDDESVPYRLDGYYYYSKFSAGKEYPVFCRREGRMENEEEVILDVNVLAEGQSYCKVAGNTVTRNHRYLAYGIDYQGRRIYSIRIKNLKTGELLEDEIPEVTGNMVWANDHKTLFYSKQDPQTLRSYQIYRHVLGTNSSEDELVYEETDDTYRAYVGRSKSRQYIFAVSASTLSNEVSMLDANEPEGDFSVILPRERKHEYSVDHYGDHFYILTNDQAKNFRLVKAPVHSPAKEHWEEVIPHRPEVLLEDIDIFKDFLVVQERGKGLNQIRVMPWEGKEYYLEFPDPAYSAYVDYNPEYDTRILRYGYESMTTPASVFDMDMVSREKTLMKQQEVLGDFSPENYLSERIHAVAKDGTQIPISLVYRKTTPLDGSAPLLQYAYGSYGISIDPYFSSVRLSLLDRGFIFAIAHIRGGSDLGRQWYEDGKMLRKMNTFTDFIACGEHLVQEGYTRQENLTCMGGSAGGLLMGAVINLRPDLFKAAVAAVPFVDVVTTMLDDEIPLTTGEYDEWGNPNEKRYYDYMLSYSPYDNIEAKDYPHLLITSGLHDSQVQYWEPTKWAAKLRELKTDQNLLLLHTNMEAGHSGASGRFEPLKEVALEYAFLLKVTGSGL